MARVVPEARESEVVVARAAACSAMAAPAARAGSEVLAVRSVVVARVAGAAMVGPAVPRTGSSAEIDPNEIETVCQVADHRAVFPRLSRCT